ncbi:HD family phosphohydrolase [Geothermobacter hydrogeniphilus]|uniref:HD family phosphohydrolase n=1 Tax=Geothermobacter hydrogeniphilus TaxID=1969733 RepID=A0A2K2H7N6_9BACT|nr:HD domain-containing phosphohydrolase [Geothermobacter hydrogeniphilus]PNU19243.1 HD family phosphohydrolase [Geothermobacter hydrogeniphilus]
MSRYDRQPILDFVRHLSTAIATATLYSSEHRQVTRLCEQARQALPLSRTGDEGVSLLFVEDELIAQRHSLGRGMYIDRLARQLRRHGIAHIKLLPGLETEEILDLVSQLVNARRDAVIRAGERLRLGRVELRYNRKEDGERRPGDEIDESNFRIEDLQEASGLEGIEEVDAEELARFAEICEAVKTRRQLHAIGISEIVARFVSAFTNEAGSFLALAPLRELDEYTFTHSINVCTLNIAQAMALGIEGQLLHDIGVAAMLHDMGKLFIPDEIITKESDLTTEEWEIMRRHPADGARYLLNTPGIPRLAVVVAYEHHMRYDNQGYPTPRHGWRQNIASQISTVSDIFDALRTERSYRGSMQIHKISQMILQMAGSQLHPQLAHNFLRVLERVTSSS